MGRKATEYWVTLRDEYGDSVESECCDKRAEALKQFSEWKARVDSGEFQCVEVEKVINYLDEDGFVDGRDYEQITVHGSESFIDPHAEVSA